MRYLVWILISLLLVQPVPAQDFSVYSKQYFQYQQSELPYRLLSPTGDLTQKYPLVVFLHGASEKGTDNEAQLSIGGRFFMRDSVRKNYPAYVLFPQCGPEDAWAYFENTLDLTTGYAKDWVFPFRKEPTLHAMLVKKLVDSLVASGKADPARIYIAGLSQGGMGVLDLLARYPETFAAGIAMCGAGDPATAKYIAGKSALWLFHGDKDPVVPTYFSQQYYRRLKKAGSVVRYTEYAGVEHNCWSKAFTEPDLLSWLFGQGRK